MTYHDIDHGNYTKVYDRSQYSAYLPDSVDWRTSNAVTGVKNQVYLLQTLAYICNHINKVTIR